MSPARYILCDEPWRPEYRRAEALRRGFGEMLIASLVLLLGEATSVVMFGDRDSMLALLISTLATSGMFVMAAVRNFSLAEKGISAVDLRGSKIAFLASIIILVVSVALQRLGIWTAILLSISIPTWMALLGYYLQRRAQSAGIRALSIVWYAALMVGMVSFVSILLLSVVEDVHPGARFINQAEVKELSGFLLIIAILYGMLITPLCVAFFGCTWEMLKQQMRSGQILDLETPPLASRLTEGGSAAIQRIEKASSP